jgi:hypothetical protein
MCYIWDYSFVEARHKIIYFDLGLPMQLIEYYKTNQVILKFLFRETTLAAQ